jgi:hypothetical protein
MQGLAPAREQAAAQEQWRAMKKTMRRAIETMGHAPEAARSRGNKKPAVSSGGRAGAQIRD